MKLDWGIIGHEKKGNVHRWIMLLGFTACVSLSYVTHLKRNGSIDMVILGIIIGLIIAQFWGNFKNARR